MLGLCHHHHRINSASLRRGADGALWWLQWHRTQNPNPAIHWSIVAPRVCGWCDCLADSQNAFRTTKCSHARTQFFFSCWSICTLLHTRILVMDACAVSTSSCETYMHSCKWREYIYMAPYRDTATSMKLQNILTVVDESTLNWALRLRPPLIVPSGKPTKLPLRTRIVGHGGNNQCAACTWACDLRLVDLSHTHTITDQKYVIWKHVARTL